MWFASVDTKDELEWTPITASALASLGVAKIDNIAISPLGTQVVLTGVANGAPKLGLFNLADYKMVKSWDGYSLAAWHPEGGRLAFGARDGKLKTIELNTGNEMDGQIPIDSVEVTEPAINRLVWFRENLATIQRGNETRWYILAQIGEKNLQFHSLDAQVQAGKFAPIVLDAKISAVACSPTDNTIAVGTVSGSVSTWFASPVVDKQPRELFSIDAHRGSVVNDITFSNDGYTLFTADAPESTSFSISRGRAFGWLSIRLPEENVEPLARN